MSYIVTFFSGANAVFESYQELNAALYDETIRFDDILSIVAVDNYCLGG